MKYRWISLRYTNFIRDLSSCLTFIHRGLLLNQPRLVTPTSFFTILHSQLAFSFIKLFDRSTSHSVIASCPHRVLPKRRYEWSSSSSRRRRRRRRRTNEWKFTLTTTLSMFGEWALMKWFIGWELSHWIGIRLALVIKRISLYHSSFTKAQTCW